MESKRMGVLLAGGIFGSGENIPVKFTCDGDNISPKIVIEGVPSSAKSLVIIMDDPDSPTGTWDHWLVFNISPDTRVIKEGEEPRGKGGLNSWGKTGYGGPCPGRGSHRYFFRFYALDAEINLPEGITKRELEESMIGHIIDSVKLMGRYERSSL